MRGNTFTQNRAQAVATIYGASLGVKGQGGALFYACNINGVVNKDSPGYMTTCYTQIDGQNSFTYNTADDGGAILWTKFRPIISSGVAFKGNKAFYGPDTGSYPGNLQMQFISNNDYVNPYNGGNSTLRMLDGTSSVPTLVSGNSIDFNLVVLDQDGNVYTSDSSSKAVLQSSNTTGVILLNN